ncbi:MAG: hypothetical protein KME16_28010 [Scytolyngbya sp. HA4215-MV1]|nr:hypothetical protein [Scytolyngbya sp. HA4215-MV1]
MYRYAIAEWGGGACDTAKASRRERRLPPPPKQWQSPLALTLSSSLRFVRRSAILLRRR